MYDHDQMTDSSELQELRDALSSVGMPGRPPLETIKNRGRAQRRRTRATRFSVGVIVAGALAVGVSLAAAPAHKLGTIQRAAYTLRHNQNGTDTLSLNPAELLNPSQLQGDLARYGISAKVTAGSYCTTTPEPAGFSQAVTLPGPASSGRVGSRHQPAITIDPSRIPAGAELSVGSFQLISGPDAGEQQANMSLINTKSYRCSSIPPDVSQPDTSNGDFGLLYGGPASSGS